jgi:O-antigen ligase
LSKTKEETYYGYDDINTSWYHLIPIMFILSVVPLIVYLKVVPLEGATYDFWNGQKENLDFFSYYKMVWLLIATVAAIVMLIVKLNKQDLIIKETKLYIPIAIYATCIILSTVFSKYKDIAAVGFPERFEGVYVLLAYLIISVLTINFIETERHIKIIVGALLVSAFVLGTIGVFQFLGHDIFKTNLGKEIILPSIYEQIADKIKFQFNKNEIYATLYNTNYVGSYIAIILPLSLTIGLLFKNKLVKLFAIALSVLMLVNLIGSNSRAGIVGGAVAILVLIIILRKKVFKHWIYFASAVIILVIAFVGLKYTSKAPFINRLETVAVSRLQKLLKDVQVVFTAGTPTDINTYPLKDLQIKDNDVLMVTPTETLKFSFNESELEFRDGEDKSIKSKYEAEKGLITLDDKRYKTYVITLKNLNNLSVVQVKKDSIILNFALDNSKFKLVDLAGRIIDYKPVKKFGFEGKERIGSGRGYIWSRSLPLLKNTIILGYGPDTFGAYFPQYDLQGKLRFLNDMWRLVDKPHNMYLQVAINTGIISLMALLIAFGMYIVDGAKLYLNNDYSEMYSVVGLGIFVAILGYLVAGFFNDSIVSIAPVFWILLGLGTSINIKLRGQDT